MRNLFVLPILLMALPVLAQQGIYSYKDADGNTIYTSEPPANAEVKTVQLPKIETMQSPKSKSSSNTNNTYNQDIQNTHISQLTLEGIPNDEALRANNGNFTVYINSNSGPLPPAFQYVLLVDGKPYGAPQSTSNIAVSNLDRGQHVFVGQVVNGTRVVAATSPAVVTIQRSSKYNPPRKPKPR